MVAGRPRGQGRHLPDDALGHHAQRQGRLAPGRQEDRAYARRRASDGDDGRAPVGAGRMKTDLTWAQDVSHGTKAMTSTTTSSSGTLNTEFKDRAYGLQNDW